MTESEALEYDMKIWRAKWEKEKSIRELNLKNQLEKCFKVSPKFKETFFTFLKEDFPCYIGFGIKESYSRESMFRSYFDNSYGNSYKLNIVIKDGKEELKFSPFYRFDYPRKENFSLLC